MRSISMTTNGLQALQPDDRGPADRLHSAMVASIYDDLAIYLYQASASTSQRRRTVRITRRTEKAMRSRSMSRGIYIGRQLGGGWMADVARVVVHRCPRSSDADLLGRRAWDGSHQHGGSGLEAIMVSGGGRRFDAAVRTGPAG
jgi:hypothetical protein